MVSCEKLAVLGYRTASQSVVLYLKYLINPVEFDSLRVNQY